MNWPSFFYRKCFRYSCVKFFYVLKEVGLPCILNTVNLPTEVFFLSAKFISTSKKFGNVVFFIRKNISPSLLMNSHLFYKPMICESMLASFHVCVLAPPFISHLCWGEKNKVTIGDWLPAVSQYLPTAVLSYLLDPFSSIT